MIIGIDIDDTLTLLHEVKQKTAKDYIQKNNLPYKLINPKALRFKDMFDWPIEECDKFWFSEIEEMLCNATPREHVCSVISRLKQMGHKIVIITARTTEWHKRPYEMSYEWLTKNNIPFDKLIVGFEDKTQVCVEEKVDVFIDDLPSTLVKLQAYNIKTILMSAPHNKTQEEYNGIVANSWLDIENILVNEKQNEKTL